MKKFLVAGFVVLATGAATSTQADDGRYHNLKEAFEEAEGAALTESVLALVAPGSDGVYYLWGTCFKPDGETLDYVVSVDLLAKQSTDSGVGDFFAEEELSVVAFNGELHEYDRERRVYVLPVYVTYSFKVVERNGDNYLLEKRGFDESTYCVYAIK